MPQALPLAINVVGGAAGWTATTIAVATIATSVAVGIYTGERQRREARRSFNEAQRDQTITLPAADAPRMLIYGEVVTGGTLAYRCTSGPYAEILHQVIALADHRVHAIDEVYIGGEAIGPVGPDGWVLPGSPFFKATNNAKAHGGIVSAQNTITLPETPATVYTVSTMPAGGTDGAPPVPIYGFTVQGALVTLPPGLAGAAVTVTYASARGAALVRVKRYLGAPGQAADPDLVAEAPAGEWTTQMVGNQVAYLIVSIRYDPDAFPSGVANISAKVRGNPVFDPRTGTLGFSRNAALCIRDFLLSPYGYGFAASEIDEASFIAAANICDEPVEITSARFPRGESQARYTIDGRLSTESGIRENLESMLLSCLGSRTWVAGKNVLKVGAYYAPVASLDDDDLAPGDTACSPRAEAQDLFNTVRGRFVDPNNEWALSDFPRYRSSAYVAEDGGVELVRDVTLPLVTDFERAQRIAKLLLYRERAGLRWSATYKLAAYPLSPGDVVQLTHAEMGWTGKLFRILERKFDARGVVALSMQEEAPAIYAWNGGEEATEPDPAPNTEMPDPRIVPPVQGLSCVTGVTTAHVHPDGTVVPFARISWIPMQDPTVAQTGKIELAYKRGWELEFHVVELPGDASQWELEGVSRGEILNVMARARNASQVRGAWTAPLVHIVSADTPAGASSPRFGVGVNLLPNSRFVNDSKGFTPFVEGATAGRTVGRNFHPSWTLANEGTLFCEDLGTAAGRMGWDSQLVPCAPGQRFELQAVTGSLRAPVDLMYLLFNAAGQYLTEGIPAGGPVLNDWEKAGGFALSQYMPLWGFVTVPESVPAAAPADKIPAYIGWRTAKRPTWSGQTSSYLFASRGYLGFAHPAQSQPSPYSDGVPRGALATTDRASVLATVSHPSVVTAGHTPLVFTLTEPAAVRIDAQVRALLAVQLAPGQEGWATGAMYLRRFGAGLPPGGVDVAFLQPRAYMSNQSTGDQDAEAFDDLVISHDVALAPGTHEFRLFQNGGFFSMGYKSGFGVSDIPFAVARLSALQAYR